MKTNARKPAQAAGSFIRSWRAAAALMGLLVGLSGFAHPLAGQAAVPAGVIGDAVSQPGDLPALIARARAANPEIRAMDESVAAARARATAAGALPDPMLGVGLVNALVSDPLSSEDFMTMRMVQVGQRMPYPGKLDLEREAAVWELAAAEAERERVEREVVASVERAYFELFFLDRSLDIVLDNRELLTDFVSVTEARYGVGLGAQQDVLKAQVEESRLGDELLVLRERHSATLAALNALLARPSGTPVG
ncbi:MAG: TolC family protein [Gemmatimonadota bacterium]